MRIPTPTHDDPEQRRLRLEVADEIEAVLRKHDVGGVVLLASRDAAAWRFVIPEWSFLVAGEDGFHLRINTKTPDARARTESTLHLVGTFRDMARDVTELFSRFFRVARMQIANSGGELVHEPFGAGRGTGRPDPLGGKSE